MIFAHSSPAHAESTQPVSPNLLDTIAHQPAWVALTISVFLLIALFAILTLVHSKLISRLLALLPLVIALSLLFFSHNPIVATLLLSGGFILTFALAFTMLQSGK